jgi:hypothetical protein
MVANFGESGFRDSGLSETGGAMRAEWREEQEQATADAAAQWRHARKLTDWFEARMNAGDRIEVMVGGQRFAGFVEEVGSDLLGLRCAFGRVDIHIVPGVALLIEVSEKAIAGGVSAREHRSFADALLARDGHPDSTVGTLHDPEGLDGALWVGSDFVSVVARQGRESVVPNDNILWVSARRG